MVFKYRDKEYKVKYGYRALMIYESLAKESYDPQGIQDIIILFYACMLAADKDLVLSFDEFVDILDECPYVLKDFSDYVESLVQQLNKLLKKHEEEKKQEEEEKEEKKA